MRCKGGLFIEQVNSKLSQNLFESLQLRFKIALCIACVTVRTKMFRNYHIHQQWWLTAQLHNVRKKTVHCTLSVYFSKLWTIDILFKKNAVKCEKFSKNHLKVQFMSDKLKQRCGLQELFYLWYQSYIFHQNHAKRPFFCHIFLVMMFRDRFGPFQIFALFYLTFQKCMVCEISAANSLFDSLEALTKWNWIFEIVCRSFKYLNRDYHDEK